MSFPVISGFVGKGGFLSNLISSSVFVMRFMKYVYQETCERFSFMTCSLVRVLVLTSTSGVFVFFL